MIKNKRKIKVPAAKFGLSGSDISDIIQGTGNLVGQGIAAANNDGSAGSAIASGLGMAATGAKLGSVIPGIGTGIGAAAGAVTGILTSGLSGGRDAQMTSFTDYDEGELAGFLRPGKRRKQRRLIEQMKRNAYANRAAVQGTEYLQDKWAEEYGDMDTNTFANGGTTATLAYVDDGELIQTPNGQVSKVPEQGKPTDSNLVSLPEGSKILSDSLKVPGTNKTFAQVGEEMMTTKKSKFNDVYAQNAAKLNEMNNKSIHDQLFEMQEQLKAKKGIKRKYKNAVVAAKDGIVIPYTRQPKYSNRYQLSQDGSLRFTANPDEVVNIGDTVMYEGVPYVIQSRYTKGNSNNAQWLASPGATPPITIYRPNTTVATTSTPSINAVSGKVANANPTSTSTPLRLSPSDWITDDEYVPSNNWRRIWTSEDLPQLGVEPGITNVNNNSGNGPERTSFDWEGTLSQLGSTFGSLIPIISNLREKPEYQKPVYNPYASTALRAMRRRRYDINPAIRDIERNRAITNYDASQMNTNTGADLAFRLQNASNTNRAIADVRSTENNVNNAYLGEYAQMAANLGEQWAAESRRVDDANMANRAQARNIRRAGLSGISQYLQNNELMRNQRNRDNAMLLLYYPFLEYGNTEETMKNWENFISRLNNITRRNK